MATPSSHVLLVEDHDDARELQAEFLRLEGFDVDEARSGEEALERVRARRPALVITDITLPGMDGFELAQRLRSSPETRDVPVVAATGHAHLKDDRFARVVIKPVDLDLLLRVIRELTNA
jgi:CheY-like chemotaxis protein